MRNILIILSIIAMSSCDGKPRTQGTVTAQQAADKIRESWITSGHTFELTLEGADANFQNVRTIGVYAPVAADATEAERQAFRGTAFTRQGRVYTSPDKQAVAVDTALAIYTCFPYHQGITTQDTIRLKAPFGENLFGKELLRSVGNTVSVRVTMQSSMALLRIVLKSNDLRDMLTGMSIFGNNIFTDGYYMPYSGTWTTAEANGSIPIRDADCLLNNGRGHDFYLIPTEVPDVVTVIIRVNGRNYAVKATLPPMRPGSITVLNLYKNKKGLAVSGSWVETIRPITIRHEEYVDSVKTGYYLQKDGRISCKRNKASVAVVIATDGKHGKAVALSDSNGEYCFSEGGQSGGRTFPTIDGKCREGIINSKHGSKPTMDGKIIYKPGMPYDETCALGYADGAALTQRLIGHKSSQENTGLLPREDMLSEVSRKPGSYVPSLAEMADFHYHTFLSRPDSGCEPLHGEYLTCTESSDDTFYLIDMDRGIVTGSVSKQYARLKLRLFYLF